MNEKLKTLKNLENVHGYTVKHLRKDFKKGVVNKNIITSTYFLRQEAIRWIKALESQHNYPNKIPDDVDNTVGWIKHFFNIEDVELKQ